MAIEITDILNVQNSPDGTTFFMTNKFRIKFDFGYPQYLGITRHGMMYKKWEKQGSKVYSVVNADVPDILQQHMSQEVQEILELENIADDIIIAFTERELVKKWYDDYMRSLEGVKELMKDLSYMEELPNKCHIIQQCIDRYPEDYI